MTHVDDDTQAARTAVPPSVPGASIPGYDVEALIGQGGFGSVYRCRQERLSRTVAVKVLSTFGIQADTQRRFERECVAIGSLSGHPHIVTVHDSGVTQLGQPYIAMEYMQQGSLAQRLRVEGPLPWQSVCEVAVKLCGAIATAHSAGILHRDIKPENVLLSAYGEPKLGDFGVSSIPGGYQTHSGIITASVAHAPPEILSGDKGSERSDVYSLASTLYTLLAGRGPFVRDDEVGLPALITRVVTQPPPPLAESIAPPALMDVLNKALAKEPHDRHLSVAAFGHALQQVQTDAGLAPTAMPIGAPDAPGPVGEPATQDIGFADATDEAVATRMRDRRPLPPLPKTETPSRKRWRLVSAIVAGLALAGAGTAVAMMNRNTPVAVADHPTPDPVVPEVTFTSACQGLRCTFTGVLSDGEAQAWAWDLGDGAEADTQTVEHTFPRAGDHPVTLAATLEDRSEVVTTETVEVEPDTAKRRVGVKMADGKRDRVVATGAVRSPRDECTARQDLVVQRRTKANRWKTVAQTVSKRSGAFRVVLPARAGAYRVRAAEALRNDAVRCAATTSQPRRYTPPPPPEPIVRRPVDTTPTVDPPTSVTQDPVPPPPPPPPPPQEKPAEEEPPPVPEKSVPEAG